MKIAPETTSKNPKELLKVIANLENKIKENEIIIEENQMLIQKKDLFIEKLSYRLDIALRHRYASRSEKLDPNHPQMHLFNEDQLPEQTDEAAADEVATDTVTVNSHQRKKTGKKPLPANLPRVRREYDISDAEKQCGCGAELTCIGEEVSEQLEIIPAKMYVICHAKKKYACQSCHDVMKQAKAPKTRYCQKHGRSGFNRAYPGF